MNLKNGSTDSKKRLFLYIIILPGAVKQVGLEGFDRGCFRRLLRHGGSGLASLLIFKKNKTSSVIRRCGVNQSII